MATTKNFLIGALSTTAVALALMSPAKAEIVLSGDPNGWTFGFDGIINVFGIDTGTESVRGGSSTTTNREGTTLNVLSTASSHFGVSDGLLPEVFGFNAHSPDFDGNKVTGRLSLEPGLGNSSGTFNQTGTSTGNTMEVREAWTSIAGAWGEFAAGKMLGIFGSQAILNDITLFGVGAGAGSGGQLNTTLGRIGYGYQYASWQANMRYTTPAMNGFKATVGIFEPNTIYSGDVDSGVNATKTYAPKVEGGVTYAGKIGGSALSLWANGMWQDAVYGAGVTNTAAGTTYNLSDKTVTIGGGDFGGKVSVGPLDFVGYGYVGQGLNVNGLQSGVGSGALGAAVDAAGNTETGYGYYVQGLYHFGQGTSLGVSYGSSFANPTGVQAAELSTDHISTLKEQDLLTAQVYHDINKAFRVVAEYDYTTARWNDSATQNQNTFSVGVVALW